VDFDTAGPGVWRGGYDSGKIKSINNSFLDLECGINRVAVRSTRTPGEVMVTARSGNLKPASITLRSLPAQVENGSLTERPPLPLLTSLPKPNPEDFQKQDTSEPKLSVGRCLKTFSYSGPTTSVGVQEGAKDGAKIYTDREFTFRGLPESLKGSDWVQTAAADKLYSAVDLMELAPGADSMVYIAHDDRLPRPEWLQRLFTPTPISLNIEGKPMKLFERRVPGGESLTLGSNTEDRKLKSCNMYIVFVKQAEPEKRAGS